MRHARSVSIAVILTVAGIFLNAHALYAWRGKDDVKWAGDKPTLLCPPVPVAGGDTCECEFFNYGPFPKHVSIRLFSAENGPVGTCSDVVVTPQRGTECVATFQDPDICACSISLSHSGSHLKTRASINVVVPGDQPRAWDGRACTGPAGR